MRKLKQKKKTRRKSEWKINFHFLFCVFFFVCTHRKTIFLNKGILINFVFEKKTYPACSLKVFESSLYSSLETLFHDIFLFSFSMQRFFPLRFCTENFFSFFFSLFPDFSFQLQNISHGHIFLFLIVPLFLSFKYFGCKIS